MYPKLFIKIILSKKKLRLCKHFSKAIMILQWGRTHILCFFISFLPWEAAKRGSRLYPPGSYLLANTFQLFLMKRNGPFCGEEKRFQGTMTRDEVALSLSDARVWRAKSELTCNSSKHAYKSTLLTTYTCMHLLRYDMRVYLCHYAYSFAAFAYVNVWNSFKLRLEMGNNAITLLFKGVSCAWLVTPSDLAKYSTVL